MSRKSRAAVTPRKIGLRIGADVSIAEAARMIFLEEDAPRFTESGKKATHKSFAQKLDALTKVVRGNVELPHARSRSEKLSEARRRLGLAKQKAAVARRKCGEFISASHLRRE